MGTINAFDGSRMNKFHSKPKGFFVRGELSNHDGKTVLPKGMAQGERFLCNFDMN